MKRVLLITFVLSAFALSFTSCTKEPTACFAHTAITDSLKVGKPVTFDAGCSSDSRRFVWYFTDDQSRVEGKVVKHVYKKSGTFAIYLTVYNNDKSDDQMKNLYIAP